jgi:hypothetical protein
MPKIPVDLFFRVTRMVDEDSGYNKNLGVNTPKLQVSA